MKHVLITGGAGFIGSHVVESILKNTNWFITLIDRLDTTSTLHRLSDMDVWAANKHRVHFVYCDLKSPVNGFVAAKLGKPEYVLHLAASTHVDRSITDPELFVMDNVVATLNLLQWARTNTSLVKFNYFSTDEVMGSAAEGVNYKETDMPRPENPYAAAKLGGEALAHAFACTYSMPIFITRTMNVYGERQHPEKFIPMVIGKINAGHRIQVHADKALQKSGTRYYIHARNIAAALLHLLEHGELLQKEDRLKGIYNIVGEREISNEDMVKLIGKFIGIVPFYTLVDFHSSRPGHDLRYALDGTKLLNSGFDYPKTLEQSLEKTIRWFLQHPEWLNI